MNSQCGRIGEERKKRRGSFGGAGYYRVVPGAGDAMELVPHAFGFTDAISAN